MFSPGGEAYEVLLDISLNAFLSYIERFSWLMYWILKNNQV